jgi:hypothetical protein
MEGIVEALLQLLVEIAFEIVGAIAEGLIEFICSSDFWNFFNRPLPERDSFSSEIITLDIFNQNKEILKK